jgi:hypothetical protein
VAEPAGVAVPAWHGVQVPAAWLYLPLGQSVHLVAPLADSVLSSSFGGGIGEDWPAAQLAQVSMAPVLPWNLPAGHGLQGPVTVSLNLPIGQAAHGNDEVEAGGEKYPVGQLAHEVWPVLLWNLLPGQAGHPPRLPAAAA